MTEELLPGRYVHPHAGRFGRALQWLFANRSWARWRRALLARLAFVTLASDVTDVVYLNWCEDAARLAPLVPDGLRLWVRDGRTVLTVLTYRHGGFGPAWIGPLRRLCGSPLQSNWRLYLDDPAAPDARPDGPTRVFFLANFLDSLPHLAGARLFSDALPAQRPAHFAHAGQAGRWRTCIRLGDGRCALESTAGLDDRPGATPLPPAFTAHFPDAREAVRTLSLQESAVVVRSDGEGLAEAGIALPIPLEEVRPLRVEAIASDVLEPLVAGAPLFAFLVPRVPFRVLWERGA